MTEKSDSHLAKKRARIKKSNQILIALAAGIAVGLFFGERVAFLNVPAKVFVNLLQITAYFICCSATINHDVFE